MVTQPEQTLEEQHVPHGHIRGALSAGRKEGARRSQTAAFYAIQQEVVTQDKLKNMMALHGFQVELWEQEDTSGERELKLLD